MKSLSSLHISNQFFLAGLACNFEDGDTCVDGDTRYNTRLVVCIVLTTFFRTSYASLKGN